MKGRLRSPGFVAGVVVLAVVIAALIWVLL